MMEVSLDTVEAPVPAHPRRLATDLASLWRSVASDLHRARVVHDRTRVACLDDTLSGLTAARRETENLAGGGVELAPLGLRQRAAELRARARACAGRGSLP